MKKKFYWRSLKAFGYYTGKAVHKLIKWFFIAFLAYGISYKPVHFSSTQLSAKDVALVKVAHLLAHTPLQKEVSTFIDAAEKYHLQYYLLPLVACVESSCGKHYKYNAFGWDSDTKDFGNDSEDIYAIASKISTLPYYKKFRETKNLHDFANAYNKPYAEEYYKKLMFFYEKYMH